MQIERKKILHCQLVLTCEQFLIKILERRCTTPWIKNTLKHYLFAITIVVHLEDNLFATSANQNKQNASKFNNMWLKRSQSESQTPSAPYQRFVERLTASQPNATRSLSSVITAAIPPFFASRLHRYASCASASYGATTNSTFSDLRTWKANSVQKYSGTRG